ncbi:hypothetical protein TRFO_27311 [Tritrichomonas foetus]|uniref:Uncharacterized protein n=1 Tax=Tritrichomonas foetus TaxID=1144522 RepID=A0A1J4K0V6_9EUKA|nr:hypothetical protein TRFO_27311 [Tritrichomonas foetus]|eukprot:OHT05007.1 hypothetical protein TRFO_27311 [Tritrichomonas foetus]
MIKFSFKPKGFSTMLESFLKNQINVNVFWGWAKNRYTLNNDFFSIPKLASIMARRLEMGTQAVFLGSCAKKCPTPFYSHPKRFNIFNTNRKYSVQIKEGIGVFDILDLDSEEDDDSFESEFNDFTDLFEIENGKITENESPEMALEAVKVFDHIKKQVGNLYYTTVTNLHLAFAISIDDSSEKTLYLTDVFSCVVEEHLYCNLFQSVPDGFDIVSQVVILFSRYRFKENQCLCFTECDNRCPKAAIGATLKYKINKIFFDCNVAQLNLLIKKLINSIDSDCYNNPVTLCPSCYMEYQLYENEQVKSAQLLQRYSQSIQEERRQQAIRKSLNKGRRRKKSPSRNTNFSQTGPLYAAGRCCLNDTQPHAQKQSFSKTFGGTSHGKRLSFSLRPGNENINRRQTPHGKMSLLTLSNLGYE